MTLADWKRKLKPGLRLACTYRHYWDKSTDTPKPAGGQEIVTIRSVHSQYVVYSTVLKSRVYMDYPKASVLKAGDTGFDLYFPSGPEWKERAGILMSSYVYLSD